MSTADPAEGDESAIQASYRERYCEPDPQHDQLVATVSQFAIFACLNHDEH